MPFNRPGSSSSASYQSGTLAASTPVSLALESGSLPRSWSVNPASGCTVRVETFNGSVWDLIYDVTAPAFGTLYVTAGEPTPTQIRFTRVAGSASGSSYALHKSVL